MYLEILIQGCERMKIRNCDKKLLAMGQTKKPIVSTAVYGAPTGQ